MKIDDIQIEAVAKNHLWANIARDGEAFILTDFRHLGELRIEWDGDILWLSHSSGEQIGVSTNLPISPILDAYLPGVLEYFAQGGEKPNFPSGVLVEGGETLPPDGTTEREQVIAARVGQGVYRERLLARWDGACAVTGLAEPALLMASHARPWKGATFGVDAAMHLAKPLNPEQQSYMAYHRDHVFKVYAGALPQATVLC